MEDPKRADETAHFVVKSVYKAMSVHVDNIQIQVGSQYLLEFIYI